MLEITGGRYLSCDGVSRRGFLKAGVLGLTGLTLADALRLRAARAVGGAADSRHLGHPDLEGRRAEPPRHVGPQARRPRRISRRVQADRHQRRRHPGRRASAALGQADGQVRDRPVGHPSRLGARVGQPLPADRLPADQRHPRAGDAELRLDHRQGPRPETSRPAGVPGRAHASAKLGGRLPRRRLQPVLGRRRPERRQVLGPQPDPPRRDQPGPPGEPPRHSSTRSTPSAATATDPA